MKLILTLAGVLSATMAFAQSVSPDYELQRPIEYKCPHENNGVFVLDSRSISGKETRLVVFYEGDDYRRMTHSELFSNGHWKVVTTIDFGKEKNADEIYTSGQAIRLAETIRKKVCIGGPANRKRFERFLQDNRKSTGR